MISVMVGIYFFILIDVNGCFVSDELIIMEVVFFVFEIDGDDFFCVGDQVMLFVLFFDFVMYSYDWSIGDDGGSVMVNQEGEVSFEVIDQFGCVVFNVVFVLEVFLFMVDLGSFGLLDCDMDEVLLGGLNFLEGDNYIYIWFGFGINIVNEDE